MHVDTVSPRRNAWVHGMQSHGQKLPPSAG